jgi:4,5-DOPA dioxygenase extradiol
MQAELVKGRGWDHGVFIPLLLMLEAADIPVLQVSLLKSLDPAAHIRLGRSLASLRDQGVFILGSGLSYHNMRGFGGGAEEPSKRFHAWLTPTLCDSSPAQRCGPGLESAALRAHSSCSDICM